MKKTILITLTSLMLAGFSFARVWTNTDGTKTFKGDFVSCDGTLVTVKQGARQMTFKLEVLSEEDQAWAIAEAKKLADAEAKKAGAADFAESDFGKALAKLQKFDGSTFVEHQLEETPKFFLLYFSASW